MTETQVPAGWYPDPAGVPGKLRYWDGSMWTEYYQQTGISPYHPTAMAGQAPLPPASVQYPVSSQAQVPGPQTQVYPNQPIQDRQPYYQVQPTEQHYPYGRSISGTPIYTVAPEPAKTGREICAIVSLVIGLFTLLGCCVMTLNALVGSALCLLLGIPSLILGILGIKSARKGFAITGISLGGVFVILGALMLLAYLTYMGAAPDAYYGSNDYIF